jgi:hypothetical protein
MKVDKYLSIILVAILLIFCINYFNDSIRKIYYFKFTKTILTKGQITGVEKKNSIEGDVSFVYNVKFSNADSLISFSELFSPDSLNVALGDSVFLKYPINRPQIASLKIHNNFYSEIGTGIILIFFIVFLLFKSFKKNV